MNSYPFLIRAGPHSRTRRIFSEGINFYRALEKVLSIYPSKFVNFKHARNMDLSSVKTEAARLSKKNKGVRHTVWLNEKEGEFYISFPNEKGFIMLMEDENSNAAEIGTARLNRFKEEKVYVNGLEVALEAKSETENKPPEAKSNPDKGVTKTKVMSKKVSTKGKTAVAKKVTVKKEPKEETTPRGNNLSLTKAEWTKVDAILKKEDVSWSAWVKGLVRAKI